MKYYKIGNPKTIRGKIMGATSVITILIALITVTVCFSIFQSFLKRNQIQSAEFNLQLVSNNVSADMKDIIYFSNWCCSNKDILNYLTLMQDKEELAARTDRNLRRQSLVTFDRLWEEYHSTKPASYIERVIISTQDTANFVQLMPTSDGNKSYAARLVADSTFFPALLSADDHTWIGFAQNPFVKAEDPILPLVRPVYDEFSTAVLGWSYLSVSPRIITDYLRSFPLEEDSRLYITIGDQMYTITGHRLEKVVPDYQIIKDVSGNAINPRTTVKEIRFNDSGRTCSMVTFPVGVDGWYLSQVLSHQQLGEQRSLYVGIIIVICLIILTLGIVLAFYMNRSISQPVELVRKKIDRIAAGDFSLDPSIEWAHEIGDIGRGINHLSQEIVSLMDRRVADEKQKKDLEYQILQSQINPHFLYNTLNSIKWMATIQNASGIAEMTTALARLMKNVSKGTAALIPLREELDLVRDYFLIQQYRYGGSLSITYEIGDDRIYDCPIHRFTLQPIIENALFHGIEPKGCAGRIEVRAELTGVPGQEQLCIAVTDNGIGMSEEAIRHILSGETKAHTKEVFFKQVGIRNVNQRIKYEFGDSYGITITSVPGEYTTMSILIPYQAAAQK